MNKTLLFLATASTAAVLQAQAEPSCAAKSDFLVRSDPTLAPVRPADCSTTTQTPPEFSWPPQNGKHTYEVTLTLPDGSTQSRTTQRNILLWDKPLPSGKYTWRVKVVGPGKLVSEPRSFTIAPHAVEFLVPSAEELVRNAKTTPRPRTWSRDETRPLQALKAERASGFRLMRQEVENKMPAPVQPEPNSTSDGSNYEDTVAEQKRTLAAAYVFAVTRDPRYGADAARRMLAQARWSTTGAISYKKNDMAHRNVAWTLALAYDWAHDAMPASQRALVLAAIKARTQTMYEDVVERLARYPYDSHGNLTLTIVAAIGALMVGEIPEADDWLQDAVPVSVMWTSPWGGGDGGFGNGTQQLFWDTGSHLPAWYVLRNAAGVNLAKKEWVRNHIRFMAYFVPPGAPSGVFGDGHELKLDEVWSRVAKATARFASNPYGAWYASAQRGEDPGRIELMVSPRVNPGPARLPPGAPNSAYFPSVGWVAMHSNLADPERTSVYFKSSPYGSYNHSHADQNSFVIHHRGERLLVHSGYYDGYQTPHWREWYKQTKAVNAVTFDGGKGQGFNDKGASGTITRYEDGPGYTLSTGRAEKAYGGALTLAERSIVYLRPGVVVVHDRLASATPRRWEWNLHALQRMHPLGEKLVAVRNGEARMCVEMLHSPEAAFEQHDRFSAPPRSRNASNQWHGAFVAAQASDKADFIAVMRIGADCAADGTPAAKLSTHGEAFRVEVAGHSVLLGPEGPRVLRGPAEGTRVAGGAKPAL